METWRFRIMVAMALVILIFGDFLGYGQVSGERKLQGARQSPTMRDDQARIFLDDEESANQFLYMHTVDEEGKQASTKVPMTAEIRDACLPKMLCEIGTRQQSQWNEREGSLMELIRSTTLSLMGIHTKWHYAAHMGYLMRHIPESGGCAMLFPHCPFSTTRTQDIRSKMATKI